MNKLACVLFYIVIDVLLLLFAQDADVRGSKALDIDVLGTARVLSANAKDGSHFGRCEGKAVSFSPLAYVEYCVLNLMNKWFPLE